MKTLNRFLLLLIVVIICGTAFVLNYHWNKDRYPWESTPPPKTDEQVIVESERVAGTERVKYLAAIIRHSFRSDRKEMLLVALAAKNTSELIGQDYKTVFEQAAEQVPPWSKKSLYIRTYFAVRSLASIGEWNAAKSLAIQTITGKFQEPYKSLLEAMPESQKCVTTFYRVEGLKTIPTIEDLGYLRAWRPKAYENKADGAFWLCLPLKKPKETQRTNP